jgi:hypothetical protein
MTTDHGTEVSPAPPERIPLRAAADLQDHLLVASNDLDRLRRLLEDASDTLIGHFYAASAELDALMEAPPPDAAAPDPAIQRTREHVAGAITAMQFGDLATQLLFHTVARLRVCADRLARDAMDGDGDGPTLVASMPTRPNPVTQDEMDAGSIELF